MPSGSFYASKRDKGTVRYHGIFAVEKALLRTVEVRPSTGLKAVARALDVNYFLA